jgi:hypothetical protein
MDKRRAYKTSARGRGHGPTGPRRLTPPGVARRSPPPATSMIWGIASTLLLHPWLKSVWSKRWGGAATDPWAAVIYLEGPNWPLNCLTSWRTDLPTMQLPSKSSSSTVGWQDVGGAGDDRSTPPRPADAPCLSTTSPLPTSTPMPSTHYKRGCGARWISSLKHSKHSKLSRVVALEVVAS